MILDGKLVAKKIRSKIKSLISDNQLKPGLATILVGSDPASQIYVGSKQKTAKRLGFHSIQIDLPHDCTASKLTQTIEDLNQNPEIHGILLQLPLPKHLDSNFHLAQISPLKDVDGFHPGAWTPAAPRRLPKSKPYPCSTMSKSTRFTNR